MRLLVLLLSALFLLVQCDDNKNSTNTTTTTRTTTTVVRTVKGDLMQDNENSENSDSEPEVEVEREPEANVVKIPQLKWINKDDLIELIAYLSQEARSSEKSAIVIDTRNSNEYNGW